MAVTAHPVPILSDNYAWLLRDEATGATALVDPAEDPPLVAAVQQAGGRLDLILLTHHHADHVAAVEPLRRRFGARVVGARADLHRLPRLDRAVAEGDTVELGSTASRVIATPGHTSGHLTYFFPDGPVAACGDTLFSLGCGKLFEGSAEDMFQSLAKLKLLPPDTLIACGHEYTEGNARFALHVDPDNPALRQRAEQARSLRRAGLPTLPCRLGDELRQNPFLRAPDAATLGTLRNQKNTF